MGSELDHETCTIAISATVSYKILLSLRFEPLLSMALLKELTAPSAAFTDIQNLLHLRKAIIFREPGHSISDQSCR